MGSGKSGHHRGQKAVSGDAASTRYILHGGCPLHHTGWHTHLSPATASCTVHSEREGEALQVHGSHLCLALRGCPSADLEE